MSDFTIHALPKSNKEVSKIPSNLPQSNLLFVAPSNSGKTTLLVNLILKKAFGYIFHFDEIHIFSPTIFLDDSWNLVQIYTETKQPKKHAKIFIHDEYDKDLIEDIIVKQKETDKENRKRILIILDDLADQLTKGNDLLKKLFFKGRHWQITTWISSQSYKAIPRSIRINSPGFIFMNLNTNERSMIISELSREDKKTFLDKFDRCISEKYSFLYLNMKSDIDEMYCQNFVKYY